MHHAKKHCKKQTAILFVFMETQKVLGRVPYLATEMEKPNKKYTTKV